MTALSETHVQSAEEHVLSTFVRHEATTLSAALLFEESGAFVRDEIASALAQLEHRDHALLRYRWDGTDWVTLTLLGVARRGGVAAPSVERRGKRSSAAPEIIFEHSHRVIRGAHEYCAYILGVERSDGTWGGWIEFVPTDGTGRLRTTQESSQPNRDALAYWASGLEDVYLDGALARATA